ncbi:MAG: DUF4172 domain-containing protein [Prevotella sp.]
MYIHERDNWPHFRWEPSVVAELLETVVRKQGMLYGRLSALGFDNKLKAMADKRPSYSIVFDPRDITSLFSDIKIVNENQAYYLTALFKGKTKVLERILPLDAERFNRGDLTLQNLIGKYCSYLN